MPEDSNTIGYSVNEPEDCEKTVDVIVVGSGFAGLAAAIEAKLAGSEVLVIEKTKAIGGNSIICDGGIAAPGTDLQERFNITDSKEQMAEDMLKAGLGLNHPRLVRTLVNQAKETFEWSRNYLGVPYMERVDIFGGHSVPRCYTAENVTGATIIRCMVRKLKELEITVQLETLFESFILDERQSSEGPRKRVCGITASSPWDYRSASPVMKTSRIYVRNAVVLATGGFSSDIAFRSLQDPRLDSRIDTTNKPFATAEALRETLRLGAVPVQLSHIQLGPWASPDEKGYGDGPAFSEYIVFQYGIMIDPETGKRFVNELADRKTLSDQILAAGHPCIGIADSAAVENSGWNISRCLKKGVVKPFQTIQEMAKEYHISHEILQDSINRFNECIETGKDTEFGKVIPSRSHPLKTPPYYAIRLWPKVHYTMGGIGINENAEALYLDGSPIPGLFAAGEVTGGIHGASRLGSCAITDCLVFGRIAGKNAAAPIVMNAAARKLQENQPDVMA